MIFIASTRASHVKIDKGRNNMNNKNNANKAAKTMSDLGKNLVIRSKNGKKTILPKSVGEELERAQYPYRDSFDKYYYDSLKRTDSPAYHYIMNEPIQSDRNEHIVNLLNAWISGWEEEK